MTAWFSNKECSVCGSLLATDGTRLWCVNECGKNVDGAMIYGQWVEWEGDGEEDE